MAAGEGSVPPGRGAEGVPPRPDSRRPRARCRRGGCGRRKAPVVRAASGPSSTPTPGGATPSARPVSRPWPRGRRPPLRLTAPAFGGEWVELRSAVSWEEVTARGRNAPPALRRIPPASLRCRGELSPPRQPCRTSPWCRWRTSTAPSMTAWKGWAGWTTGSRPPRPPPATPTTPSAPTVSGHGRAGGVGAAPGASAVGSPLRQRRLSGVVAPPSAAPGRRAQRCQPAAAPGREVPRGCGVGVCPAARRSCPGPPLLAGSPARRRYRASRKPRLQSRWGCVEVRSDILGSPPRRNGP